ncbi:monooxygenase [Granulicoccus sp. GXG6511]|uniref:monooxygenase n=1 Tax=Granulicoccus sp. GXG6511 TaxID=3381351 RepID=UPI003D7F18B1
MATLVQFDFPANGPWGAEMSAAYAPLADDIAAEPGLRWKIWTENAETQTAGGIYLFDDAESAKAYAEKHTARLQSFGITDIRALFFDVNEALSGTTRGPLG